MAKPSPADRINKGLVVPLLLRAKPLRRLPGWSRYLITAGFVLVCFAARYPMSGVYPSPYLMFLPGILAASFVFDRGSGFFATGLSGALAVYFFIDPIHSFAFHDLTPLVSVALFLLVGLLTAIIVEALRSTVEDLVAAIEAQGRGQEQLKESLNVLEAVIEGVPDPIFVKDREGRFLRVNSMFARLMGATPAALVGHTADSFLPDDQVEQVARRDREVMQQGRPLVEEEEIQVAANGPRWFLSTRAPWYGPDGSLGGLIGIARDIHDRKQAEEAVRAASAQKDLLLRDINHRIKNHLQSVMATLAMSRRRIDDPTAREAIQATITRLTVLARVYDRLQLKPGGEAAVDAKEFIEGLCGELQPGLIELRPIALVLDVEAVALEIGRAVALGLIINEALTNALKYAFPDDASGTVRIRFQCIREECRLEVGDDGVGLPADAPQDGTGRRLIRALAQQLGGSAAWSGPPGTTVEVRFPVEPASAAA